MASRKEVIDLCIKHFGKVGGAAVAGNIDVETEGSFNFETKQKGGSAVGLIQMEQPMRTAYEAWLKEKNLSDSASSQIGYVADELAHGKQIGPGNGKKVKQALDGSDVEKATEVFCELFERAGKPHMDRRKVAAKKIYDENKK